MSINVSYLEYVLEQLQCMGHITAKKMFGGVGLYSERWFFGLIANDTLYLKVDDSNRPDYEKAGTGPFKPYGDKSYSMNYYEVPIDILENQDLLMEWGYKALTVAKRKSSKAAKA